MKIIIIIIIQNPKKIDVFVNDKYILNNYIENINNKIILFNKKEFAAKIRYNKYKKRIIRTIYKCINNRKYERVRGQNKKSFFNATIVYMHSDTKKTENRIFFLINHSVDFLFFIFIGK